MQKIFMSQNITLVNFYKSLLESNGIDCIIKNYFLTSGVGDLPPNEVVPELWIINDHQIKEAMALLHEKNTAPSWQCICGEKLDGQFGECWKCGRVRGENK